MNILFVSVLVLHLMNDFLYHMSAKKCTKEFQNTMYLSFMFQLVFLGLIHDIKLLIPGCLIVFLRIYDANNLFSDIHAINVDNHLGEEN